MQQPSTEENMKKENVYIFMEKRSKSKAKGEKESQKKSANTS